MEVLAELGHKCRISGLEVIAETCALVGRETELHGMAPVERFAEIEHLLSGNSHDGI